MEKKSYIPTKPDTCPIKGGQGLRSANSGFSFHSIRHYIGLVLFTILLGYNNLTYAQPVVYSTPGTYTFTVPAGVTSISIECWGGGAGGNNGIDRGGGGGAYAGNLAYTVTPGATYIVTVGAGAAAGSGLNGENSSFGSVVIAVGGGKGTDNGAGGLATDCTGAIRYSGGDGGTSAGNGGAGGGGSAGAGSAGSNGGNTSSNSAGTGGSGGTAGAGTAGANGGNGGNRNNDGNNGSSPGGGGGERGENGSSSGGGGNGRVIVSWPGYCYSNGNTSYQTSVTRCIFNTINNSSAKLLGGYSDYTSISTNVQKGNSYNLTVNVNTDGNYSVRAYAWIDWNQDLDFDDAGETFNLGSVTNTPNGATNLCPLSITVPAAALLGNTRMRISAKFSSNPTSCETNFDGEVEDYTINVVSQLPTITSFSPTSACAGSGTSVVITGTNFMGATNVSFNGIAATFVINSATQITATLPATATTGKISVTTPGGTANSVANFTVNALSTAPTSITGNTTICNGSSTTLSVSGGLLGTGASWKWYSGSCGGTAIGTGTSITVSPTANTTYYVRAEGACNNTTCVSRSVTVNALPTVAAPASVCVGGTITLSPTTGGTWTSSNTGRATVTNAGGVTGVAAGSVNFTFTNSATGCSATTTNVTVLSLTTTPVITTTPLCADNTTISGTSESGATIFIYSGATQIGTTTASGTNWTVTVSPAFVTGAVITAKAQATGKCLSNASTSIIVKPTPLTGSLYRRPNT